MFVWAKIFSISNSVLPFFADPSTWTQEEYEQNLNLQLGTFFYIFTNHLFSLLMKYSSETFPNAPPPKKNKQICKEDANVDIFLYTSN